MSGLQRELIMGDLTTRADPARNTTTIELHGEFDVGAADELRHTLVEAIMRSRPRHLVVDLGAVTFMDSTCIGTLVAAYHTACDVEVDLTVTGANPFLARVLATSGLHQLLAGRL
ncbi:MAG TPA: STAS domain-containing protein [Planosporangium sp.]|jgi:anti-anti-sigma factor|nr:STAS domain-containing protein [Planosporangium sp.]